MQKQPEFQQAMVCCSCSFPFTKKPVSKWANPLFFLLLSLCGDGGVCVSVSVCACIFGISDTVEGLKHQGLLYGQ